jgi:hypothetical protein
MDSQVVELLGRNRLVSDLLQAGLEVALPLRDRGVDLIAYADLGKDVRRFVARPIQMKASSKKAFGVQRKYAKIRDLLIAYVWFLGDPDKSRIYALTYPQAVAVAEKMGYTQTASWRQGGGYTTTRPSPKLVSLLKPYEMTPRGWWQIVAGGAGEKATRRGPAKG